MCLRIYFSSCILRLVIGSWILTSWGFLFVFKKQVDRIILNVLHVVLNLKFKSQN